MWSNTGFILFVSVLTVLHSMFLNDGKIIFSLFIILFKFSRFIFCSCDSVSFGLLGWVLFGWVALPFSEDCSSFLLGCFCLTTLDVSGIVLLPCWLFIFFLSLLLFTHQSFSHQFYLMVFHWSLNDGKSPLVPRTHLSILTVLNNAVVWIVSTCPPLPLIILFCLYQKHKSQLV